MADKQIDILLKFLTDTSAVKSGGVSKDLQDIERVAKEADKAFTHLEQEMKKASTPQEFAAIERKIKDVEKGVNDVTAAYRAQARVLRAEAAAITDDYAKAQVSRQKQIADQIGGFSRGAFALGAGTVGGIFAFATKYVNDAKQATEATRAWRQEQARLTRDGERMGEVLATQSLPLLRTAANLADKATDFVEAHPGIIRAALNTGVVLATLGAVGMAVSKGIKLYADVQALVLGTQEIAAAKLQDKAADKQMAAALLRAKSLGVDTGTVTGTVARGAGIGGTVASLAGSTAAMLGGLGLGAIIGDKIADAIEGRDVKFADYIKELKQTLAIDAFKAGSFLEGKGIRGGPTFGADTGEDWFRKVATAFGLLKDNANETADSITRLADIQGTDTFEKIIKAYDDYKQDDIKLVQDHYRERNEIVKSSLKAEADANKQYAQAVSKVNSGTSSALSSLASDFAAANSRAETKYQQDRAKIAADGAADIERIQQDSQKRLRKLAEDHNDRVADLTAQRDALGLAKENRDYKRAVNDEKKGAKEEAAQRKAEIAQRLADLKQSYEQERAQRLADYIARQAEIKAQAAERLKELATEHAEELAKIREQKATKLKELDTQFAEERKRRYQQMVQTLKDLDAGLFQINKLEAAYMQARIAEIQGIIDRANAQATANVPPGAATGGYVSGLVMTGERGPEYVMTNRTTRAAEALVGGQLSQSKLLGLMARGATTVNYQGRFSGEYTPTMRRQINRDVGRAIESALGAI